MLRSGVAFCSNRHKWAQLDTEDFGHRRGILTWGDAEASEGFDERSREEDDKTKQLLLTQQSVLTPVVSPGEDAISTKRRSRISSFAGPWLRKPEPLSRQGR